jgi:hypothetical protein
MQNEDEDDGYGQDDGDRQQPAQFVSRLPTAGQPWLRSGTPPWHMWGNSQVVQLLGNHKDNLTAPAVGQLTKIAYKRPETWNWLFAARILRAPAAATAVSVIRVNFDVTIGLGRSSQQILAFDTYDWKWAPPDAFGNDGVTPTSQLWSTTTLTPATSFTVISNMFVPDVTTRRLVDKVVGQDIQVSARISYFTASAQGDDTAIVEVGAFFSPASHTRPDWNCMDQPIEMQFAGDEIGGH